MRRVLYIIAILQVRKLFTKRLCIVLSHSVSDSLQPHGLQPTRLFCPWGFPGKNTGVGFHALLQGIFPTQGSNPGLLHCRQILYQLSYKGSPKKHICVYNHFAVYLKLQNIVIQYCNSVFCNSILHQNIQTQALRGFFFWRSSSSINKLGLDH